MEKYTLPVPSSKIQFCIFLFSYLKGNTFTYYVSLVNHLSL